MVDCRYYNFNVKQPGDFFLSFFFFLKFEYIRIYHIKIINFVFELDIRKNNLRTNEDLKQILLSFGFNNILFKYIYDMLYTFRI